MPILILLALAIWAGVSVHSTRMMRLFHRLRALNGVGDWETALRQVRTHRVLGFFELPANERGVIEAHALLGLGRLDEARAALESLGSAPMPRQTWWFWINQIINELITAGKYAEALVVAPFAKVDQRFGKISEGVSLALVQINLAEAEYNLGRWDAALARMNGLDDIAAKGEITRAGLMLQRAWVLGHLGRGPEAWGCAELIRPEELPVDYRTERHYSRAAAHLACGRIRHARAEVEGGLAIVKRPSSERNGWFFLARLAAEEARWEEAVTWCERAAAHRYRYQGGDGLLVWGDALAKLGRDKEARAAWQLAVERDPQGESARWAAERLVGSGPPAVAKA